MHRPRNTFQLGLMAAMAASVGDMPASNAQRAVIQPPPTLDELKHGRRASSGPAIPYANLAGRSVAPVPVDGQPAPDRTAQKAERKLRKLRRKRRGY